MNGKQARRLRKVALKHKLNYKGIKNLWMDTPKNVRAEVLKGLTEGGV